MNFFDSKHESSWESFLFVWIWNFIAFSVHCHTNPFFYLLILLKANFIPPQFSNTSFNQFNSKRLQDSSIKSQNEPKCFMFHRIFFCHPKKQSNNCSNNTRAKTQINLLQGNPLIIFLPSDYLCQNEFSLKLIDETLRIMSFCHQLNCVGHEGIKIWWWMIKQTFIKFW